MNDAPPRESLYCQRRDQFRQRAAYYGRRASLISNLRLAVFLTAVGCAIWLLLAEPRFGWLAGGLALASLMGFVALLVWHQRVLAAADRFAGLAELNAQALARWQRDWSGIPLAAADVQSAHCPFASDLDLFGPRSLFHLVALPSSPLGRRTLSRWFVEPAPSDEIRRRQQALIDLAPLLDLRQELALRARAIRNTEVEPFLQWTQEPGWLTQRPWLLWAARLMPALVVLLATLHWAGVIPFALWIVALVVNITLSFAYCRQIHEIFERIAKRSAELEAYVRLLECMFSQTYQADELRSILSAASVQGRPAQQELDRLHRIMACADVRYSQMVYMVLQGVALWDMHILALAERWQQQSGRWAAAWFAALARFEALSALANLSYDHPGWCFPVIEPLASNARIVAQGLGHPLLRDGTRVANDVTVGPPSTFLLVTGSNMSGKSTLLRSIGINVVLAQAGAPVCAVRFSLPPVRLGTSIRVQDSLGDGISLFMAELKRLKQVVDAAIETEQQGDRAFLYLLDEILHGTNTVERQVAVRRVMLHLLRHRAIGAISTHDLALAEVESLAERCQAVHFRESFLDTAGGHEMTFDYQLRDGLATTTNALKLLEMVGLTLNGESRAVPLSDQPNVQKSGA